MPKESIDEIKVNYMLMGGVVACTGTIVLIRTETLLSYFTWAFFVLVGAVFAKDISKLFKKKCERPRKK